METYLKESGKSKHFKFVSLATLSLQTVTMRFDRVKSELLVFSPIPTPRTRCSRYPHPGNTPRKAVSGHNKDDWVTRTHHDQPSHISQC